MKRILTLVLVLAVMLGVVAACTPDPEPDPQPTMLTVTSAAEVSLELGQSYMLAYDTDGTVQVSVSGGSYDAESQKFTATEAGTYTITLTATAQGKKETVATVKVTFTVASANKTALGTAIESAGALVKTDYTSSSWSALQTALDTAKAALNQSGISQADVDAATAGVTSAISNLVSSLVKAEIGADNKSFTWMETTYAEADYDNFADIVAEISALNANAEMTVKSKYNPAISAILDKLVAKLKLAIKSELKNNATMIVESLVEYTLTAESEDGATYSWKVDGKEVATTATLAFTPTEFKRYEIECTATKGKSSNVKTHTVAFVKADYVVNGRFTDSISVANNVISVTGDLGWGDEEGKKVTLPDLRLSGNFTVYFDVTFTKTADPAVMALFLLKDNGERNDFWVAVLQHNNRLEVATRGDSDDFKPRYEMPAGTATLDKVIHVMMTRTIKDGKAYLYAYILDDDGKVIMTHDANGLYKDDADSLGTVQLGIQAEHAHFTVSNLAVGINDNLVNRKPVNESIAKLSGYVESDYTTESWGKITAAKTQAESAATQEQVNAAAAAIDKAIAELVPATFEKAEVSATGITYAGRTYGADDYTNYETVLAQVNELAKLTLRSKYNPEIVKVLATLQLKLNFSVSGIADGTNLIVKALTEYTLTASSETEGVTYAWSVNGTAKGTGEEFKFTPESFGKVEITCQASTASGAVASRVISVSFIESDVKTPIGDKVTIGDDGSFTTQTGIEWPYWEGRNVLYDDLIFNGSFSITMDLTYNGTSDGATVATIHLLNADTLSPSWGGDWAYVGYGCICLHENPVRLETCWSGTGKKQSSDGGFDSIATAMSGVADLLEQGDTFTVKLTCYRNAEKQLQLVYSLLNTKNGEWIEFNRNEWAGDMGGGFIVGINVEHIGLTAKNVRYELLDATGSYLAGSVKSRAVLSATLVKYQDVVASEYVNGAAFTAAYKAAWALMSNNSAIVDYDAAAQALETAAKALVPRTVAVSAGALDKGYANYVGVTEFEAKFAEGVTATDVKWTYKLNGEAGEKVGAKLALENGAYTEVKLSFTVGGETYTYQYQDFKVSALSLKSYTEKVTVTGSTVSVDDGAGWGQKDQLVIENVRAQEFELVFNAEYKGTPGGGYRVMCINLFGEAIRPVFGYQREDRADRAQIGFDNNGEWTDINKADAEADYNHIFGEATKFSLKLSQDGEGKFWITFTVYRADGSVIAQKTCDHAAWYSSTTELRFTFENIDLTLGGFEVYYN